MTDYIVSEARLTVETNVGRGRAHIDVYRGQPVPADISAEQRDNLLRLGHIIEVVPDDPDGSGVDENGDGVPEGSAAQVVAWVQEGDGEERLDRARMAQEAELVKGDHARKGLLADLSKILEA